MSSYILLILVTAVAASMSPRNVLRYFLFWPVTIYVVGLKFEVGFDWVVYKNQFEIFSRVSVGDFFDNFEVWTVLFRHEPLFLITSYFGSQAFGVYELFQCAFYIIFVWSVFYLGKSLGESNVIAAFIPIHLFLLFSLEFSTLRQLLALTAFQFALGYTLRGKTRKGFLWAVAAPFFQSSSFVFVAVMYFVRVTRRSAKVWILAAGIAFLIINVVGFATVLGAMGGFLPGFLTDKVDIYAGRQYQSSIFEQAFFGTFYVFALWFSHKNRRNPNQAVSTVATITFFLSILALIGFAIPTVRNRLLYEIVVLVSLLIFTHDAWQKNISRLVVIPLAALFFLLSITQTASFMYVPYQNYAWHLFWGKESTGMERQSRLDALLRNR